MSRMGRCDVALYLVMLSVDEYLPESQRYVCLTPSKPRSPNEALGIEAAVMPYPAWKKATGIKIEAGQVLSLAVRLKEV